MAAKFLLTRGCFIGGVENEFNLIKIKYTLFLYMDADKTKILLEFFNKGHIACSALNDLPGMLLPRELFFNETIYKELKQHIPELKNLFSSSYLTALQAPAE
jgi:hypothetical protein